jgi:type IX secretion system PorP/SprF family membrane protein
MIRKLPSLFILVFCLASFESAWAQRDYHFSQFFAAPITYNPSTAGAFEGDFRAMANYRNQYSSLTSQPFRTTAFAADMPIKVTNDDRDLNFLGVGLHVVSDNAGLLDFNTLHIAGSVAYSIDLGGSVSNPSYISGGLSFGYTQRSINFGNGNWENQWEGVGFNPALSSGEAFSGVMTEDNILLGAGVTWFQSFDENTRLIMGASLLNANAPDVQLIGDENTLFRKVVYHAGMTISGDGSYVTFLPNLFMMFQGPNTIIDLGSEIEFSLWDRTQFTDFRNNLSTNVGAYYRYKDAIYFIGRVNYYDFSLGISYDFTTSSLSRGNNGQGGVELVLGYRTRFTGPGTGRQRLINSKGL